MATAMRCMNAGCGAAAPGGEWRRGWGLRSGGFATLCVNCGMAYEQLVFCDLFHQKESGWRECFFCGKRLHCGCIASKSSVELLDGGGVQCIGCMKNSEPSLMPNEAIESLPQRPQMVLALSVRSPKDEKMSNEFGTSLAGGTCELGSTSADYKMDGDAAAKGKVVQLGSSLSGLFGHIKGEQLTLIGSSNFLNRDQCPMVSSQIPQRGESKDASKDIMICESLAHACLNIHSGNSNPDTVLEAIPNAAFSHMGLPLPCGVEEGRDQNRTQSAFQQVQRACHLLPKPPKSGHRAASEPSKEVGSHMRVARPPGEGRGRNQLLPRYWPRITDQELQQISGDSNSTIVPLFEKVLSASDAGRIGRLVLPKACAEAYFPPISQPEGLPLRIQDARGKEWLFQFRFWPNNNSRMYVLEGVTPCIQSLQLQAGDTVTFSRIDPEGKLVMGFRKATNSVTLQDSQISAIANGALGTETFFPAVNENLPIVSCYSGLHQSLKGTADPSLSCLSEHLNSADGGISWQKTDKHGGRLSEGFGLQSLLVMEKKRSRNIGSKSKRLHMDNEDALELKLTWEEAQDLLRPPPSVKPSIVVIEDQEFEEYEEPPVFGKRTIFTVRTSGAHDQWTQCDDCFKWRRLPVDILLPSKWTCNDNIWDPQRYSCSAPDELSSKDLQNLLRQNADLKRLKTAASTSQYPQEVEASGLDALATAAALGDPENQTMPSIATTTKHPRHRPGCTCIVCIQPPSGKGPKHDPTCTCNVCLTVKRRFKTLMMRKKKRQSEREEAETAHKKLAWGSTEEMEANSSLKDVQPLDYSRTMTENLEPGKGQIDLNCHPERDADQQAGPSARVSMMSLLQVASLPLETYLKQNGLTSLVCGEQQVSSSSATVPLAAGESEGRTPDEGCFTPAAQEQEGGADEVCCDKAGNDAA